MRTKKQFKEEIKKLIQTMDNFKTIDIQNHFLHKTGNIIVSNNRISKYLLATKLVCFEKNTRTWHQKKKKQ